MALNKTEKSAMPPWWSSQPKKKGKGKGKGPRELERIVSQFIDERLGNSREGRGKYKAKTVEEQKKTRPE